MKIYRTLVCLQIVCALSACNDIKEKLHLLPNQDAQQCIDSERLKFKDPEVLFVANLGGRGLEPRPDEYWVRYKAKNSYGAYLQGNMFCRRDQATGKWKRDAQQELSAIMDVQIGLMSAYNNKLTRLNEDHNCEKVGKSYWDHRCTDEQNSCLHLQTGFPKCMKENTPHCTYNPSENDVISCKNEILKKYPHMPIEENMPKKMDNTSSEMLATEIVMTSPDSLAQYKKMQNSQK